MILEGDKAFSTTLRNKQRNFPGNTDTRSEDGLIFPNLTPGLQIAPGSSVFTIGSCFARNVEEALVACGLDVPTARFSAPEDEAPGRPNRILNQYNPATMLQCVAEAGAAAHDRALYPAAQGQVIDPLLATGSRAVSTERAIERRTEINTLYGTGLAKSETVVITLGLIETWFDHDSGLYLNEAPKHQAVKADPGRWEFRRLTVEEACEMTRQLVDAVRDGGRRGVVLTVSPVPLQVTFAGGDAVVANAYSKAVLRVVAETICSDFQRVDYVPSYEVVTSGGLRSFGDDQVHVRPKVVSKIIEWMIDHYANPKKEVDPSVAA